MRAVSNSCMRGLVNPKWIYLKAALFLLIGGTSAALLFFANPTVQTALLLALTIWSFCRAYYFAFYVIEKYVDPTFKFSGLGTALKYLIARTRP